MANVQVSPQVDLVGRMPPVEAGAHLDQKTFHERYQAMPPDFRAELIGGVVVVPSPLTSKHGRYHARVIQWLGDYEAETPGTALFDNTTVILGPYGEPQPDASVIIQPDCGGQARLNEDDYIEGPPELIVEVASSSESYDLHEKLHDYEEAGVREYIVVLIRNQQVRWFWLDSGKYREIAGDTEGILRSRTLPGLWLDPKALLDLNVPRLRETLRRGLTSAEHATFVEALKKRREP